MEQILHFQSIACATSLQSSPLTIFTLFLIPQVKTMNFTRYPAGPRQQIKANGQAKVSKGYKRSRMDNLRGGAKSKAILPSEEMPPAVLALSPSSVCARMVKVKVNRIR